MAVLLVAALALLRGAAAPQRPAHAANLTVYGLRARNLSASIDDKDTADAAGDLFFFLGDRYQRLGACRRSRSPSPECAKEALLAHDSVYTVTALEVDGSWPTSFGGLSCASHGGGTVAPANHFGPCDWAAHANTGHSCCYLSCNPNSTDGSSFDCKCDRLDSMFNATIPCALTGRADVRDRYGWGSGAGRSALPHECRSKPPPGASGWRKIETAQLLGGTWYSTPRQGNCDNPRRQRCSWRVVAVEQTVNASCVDERMLRAVLAQPAGAACLEANCPNATQRADLYSKCATDCVYATILGTSNSFPEATNKAIDPTLLLRSWQGGFEPEAQGGCPKLKTDETPSGPGLRLSDFVGANGAR